MQTVKDPASALVEHIRKDAFNKFKAAHPNSTEEYKSTEENYDRWMWHLLQHSIRQQLQKKPFELKMPVDFQALINLRRVYDFDDFDALAKMAFQEIAKCFIGPVFACGSRVRGDYVETNDPPQIIEWRRAVGKSYKPVSDFDIWVPAGTEQVKDLPQYADLVRHGVPENEKILIPMVQWDFSKLPKHEHARVIQLVKGGGWRELVSIHDQYGLSPYQYCCDISGLQRWYKWAVKSGTIKAE